VGIPLREGEVKKRGKKTTGEKRRKSRKTG